MLLGWVVAIALPILIATLGAGPAALVAGDDVLYTAAAVIYARKRPDTVSAVFGYHEVFHVLAIAAAALQYVRSRSSCCPAREADRTRARRV